MPVKGYSSVNLPSGLYEKVKAVIQNRNELGYRSITEFVAEAIRNKLTEMGETTPKPPKPKCWVVKVKLTEKEKQMIQYCRARVNLYAQLKKTYGHEKACRILSLYD